MVDRESLESVVRFVAVPLAIFSQWAMLVNVYSYFAITYSLNKIAEKNIDLSKDKARKGIENIESRGWIYQGFNAGPRLALEGFLRRHP